MPSLSIDPTSTLVGFSTGIFLAYLFYNTPDCITKMPNSDSCATLKKEEVPCEQHGHEHEHSGENNV